VIVSKGWIGSPNLLKLSGVGIAAELRTCLSEHGIAAKQLAAIKFDVKVPK
jgi:hypothetical protein